MRTNGGTRRRGRVCWLALALAAPAFSPVAAIANDLNEGSGDFSSNPAAPTQWGTLLLGNNNLFGNTTPSGPVIDMNGARMYQDNEYVTFTVPSGDMLTKLVVAVNSVYSPGDRMFLGISNGTSVNLTNPNFSNPATWSAGGLLGFTLVGQSMIGSNILPDLGASAPAKFPPVSGATMFSGPLGPGDYTLWMVDGDNPATYSFDLVVAQAPEVSTWAMMIAGLGLIGSLLRRRLPKRIALA